VFELGRLPEAARGAGFVVTTPTLPGHEGAAGGRMPDSRWEDWIATVRREHDELAASTGGPVVVLGFSTGGTLALRLALERTLAGLVLLAPFLAIRYSPLVPLRPLSYLRHLARAMPHLPRRPPPIRDAGMRRWASSQGRFSSFNMQATVSALELIETVTPRVGEITARALIQQGRRDSVVEPASARWLHTHLGAQKSQNCHHELIWYDQSDHLLALDGDRAKVETDMLAFLSSLNGSLDINIKEGPG
jgi:carboxylesterase